MRSLLVRHAPDLPCKRIQCGEIWSFCYAKAKNVPADKKGQFGYGDIWTWTAICADTKLAVSWLVATRDAGAAYDFMQDVASRLKYRVQLTTDTHKAYLSAVEDEFGAHVDYAVLQKIYGMDRRTKRVIARQSASARSVRRSRATRTQHISTSYVERQNLTMRMHMRRLLRQSRRAS